MRGELRVFFPCSISLVLALSLGCAFFSSARSARWADSYIAAGVASYVGDREALRAHLDKALELSDASYPGFLYLRAATLEWIAILSLEEDRFDEGLALLDTAIALRKADPQDYRSAFERSRTALFATQAARLLIAADRLDEGEKLYERYLFFIRQTGMRASASIWMGQALLDANEPERSLRYFEAGVEIASRVESHSVIPPLLAHADALEAVGRPEEAEGQRQLAAAASLQSDYLRHIKVNYDRAAFRAWEPSVLPFKLYVAEAPPEWKQGDEVLIDVVRGAAEEWADRVRPGVPAFEWVDEKEAADIEFQWHYVSSVQQRRVGHAPPRISHQRRRILSVHIGVVVGMPNGPTAIEHLRQIVLHELGHAIGLYGHSPNPDDLMYPFLGMGASEISDRDVATLRHLYPCTWDSGGVVVYRRAEAELRCDD